MAINKVSSILCKKSCCFFIIVFLFHTCADKVLGNEIINNIVSVLDHGINNEGTPIGMELNNLVKESYKKTLYFPAGTYTLTEPIVLPLDYTKNVNIIFDKNALIRSDIHLDALLKIGYSERQIVDRTLRQFSYIEGGIFDCYNADNGILVNGLKQLVSLRSISLVRGRAAHIRINVTDDFKGTGSSDTKIDNVTIHGISSNDETVGIYIDGSCHDCKISDTFIYGTKQAMVTKSAGHILNNVHILSKSSTGGTHYGGGANYRQTEGVRIETGGFFVFNQIYYDTVDKGIVVADNVSPILLLDQNISFSYLNNFGTSFIYQNGSSSMQVKMSNSIITVRNKDFTIFDFNVPMIGYDIIERFSFINCTIENPLLLNPCDPVLLQRLRKSSSDAIVYTNHSRFDTDWTVLGALVTSPFHSLLHIDLKDGTGVDFDLKYEGDTLKVFDKKVVRHNGEEFEIGYVVKGDFCLLLFKPNVAGDFYPVVSDKLGTGCFMPPPSKSKQYRLADYGITDAPLVLLKSY